MKKQNEPSAGETDGSPWLDKTPGRLDPMPATILNHTSHVVKFDDPTPVTPESVRAAVESSNAQRLEIAALTGVAIPLHPMPEFHPVAGLYAPDAPTDEQYEILAIQNGIFNAMQKYGADRVTVWVRNLAIVAGGGK